MKTKYSFILFLNILLFSCSSNHKEIENPSKEEIEEKPLPMAEGTVRIAKWQGNKKAVALFYFDDSTLGQAESGIRIFNKYHLIGTWFINPGSFSYKKNKTIWEEESKIGKQELANHTMTHKGATDNDKAMYEIGEPSRIIWRVRGDKEYGSLIAFNRGGGTSWDNVDLKNILAKFKNIDRVTTKIGERMIGQSVKAGSKPDEMLKNYPKALKDSIIFMLSFHGIAKEDGNPPMDYGNAAVWVKHFEVFAKKMEELKSEFWNAGYIQIYKYIQERKVAKAKLLQYNNNKYAVELTSEKDEKYFNEPLTLIVQLPKTWTKCSVKQNDKTLKHTIKNGTLQFDAIPNIGKISISK